MTHLSSPRYSGHGFHGRRDRADELTAAAHQKPDPMTKKDYILLAEVIRASRNGWIAGESSRDQVINHLVVLLARRLKEDNPRFDADKFSRATL